MKIRQQIPPATMTACTALLSPHVPEINAPNLVAALRTYNPAGVAPVEETRPMTRRQAADVLQVHTSTINRWLNDGTLRRVKLTGRTVRIDRAGVEALLAGEADTTGEE